MKLTVQDAAKIFRVPESDVYRWIREEGFPVHRVNEQYRFHRAELLEWATARGMRIAASEFPSATAGTSPSLAEALRRGGIHYDVEATDRASAIRAVVERMPIESGDRDVLYDVLLAREALGSTGVGEGIAIPHVRHPAVFHVQHPSVTLCFLAHPVDFGAIDGRPVHTVFSLVSRTVRSHLLLLARLSSALHDSEFRRAIVARAPKEVIFAEAERLGSGRQP